MKNPFLNYIGRKNARTKYKLTIGILSTLESDLLNGNFKEFDHRYWKDSLSELEEIVKCLPEARSELEHYKSRYELFRKEMLDRMPK